MTNINRMDGYLYITQEKETEESGRVIVRIGSGKENIEYLLGNNGVPFFLCIAPISSINLELSESHLAKKFDEKFRRCDQQKGKYYEGTNRAVMISYFYDCIREIRESMSTPIVINTHITNNNASNGGVININNGVNINKVNNTYKNTSKNTTKIVQKKTREKRTITTFCKYLYDTKPEWYLEGKFVPLSEITDEYQMYFDDYDTIPAVISRKLAGILFEQKDARTKDGHAKKKLYSFEELKERAGF